jgi:hypothetical protein
MLSIFAPLSHLFVVPTLFPSVNLLFSYYDIPHFYRQLDVSARLLVAVCISQQRKDCTVFFPSMILKNRGNVARKRETMHIAYMNRQTQD